MPEIKTIEKSIIMPDDKAFVVLPIKQYEDLTASNLAIEKILNSDTALCMDRFYGYDNCPYSTYILHSDEVFKSKVEYWHEAMTKYYQSPDKDKKIKSYRTVAIIVGIIAIISIIGNCIFLL